MMETVSKDNVEHYTWGPGCDGWHLLKSAELSIIQEHMPAGAAEVRHYHERARQFFFVLSGVANLEVGGEMLNMGAGQGHHVPAGVPHRLSNEGPEALEFLVVSVPMAHGDRVVVREALTR